MAVSRPGVPAPDMASGARRRVARVGLVAGVAGRAVERFVTARAVVVRRIAPSGRVIPGPDGLVARVGLVAGIAGLAAERFMTARAVVVRGVAPGRGMTAWFGLVVGLVAGVAGLVVQRLVAPGAMAVGWVAPGHDVVARLDGLVARVSLVADGTRLAAKRLVTARAMSIGRVAPGQRVGLLRRRRMVGGFVTVVARRGRQRKVTFRAMRVSRLSPSGTAVAWRRGFLMASQLIMAPRAGRGLQREMAGVAMSVLGSAPERGMGQKTIRVPLRAECRNSKDTQKQREQTFPHGAGMWCHPVELASNVPTKCTHKNC